jgi:hypothetical protein
MQQHKALDRHLLAAISRSVQSQRASRALDIATCLLVPSSVEIAIKIAVKSKVCGTHATSLAFCRSCAPSLDPTLALLLDVQPG